MSDGGVRRAAAVRLLIALVAIALLIFAWHPWSGASRPRAGRTEATSAPATTEKPGAGDKATRPDGEVEEEGPGEEEEEEEERTYRATVVSRRDGSPIARAKIHSGETCHGTTDADGVVEFRAGSSNWWRASAPGFFPVDLDFDGDGSGWVALPPATIVTGKVLDAATRRPIRGADVRLWAKDRWDDETAATDETGRFEVAGALWQGYSLVVQADGYCPAEVEGSLAGPLHGLEIALAEAAILQGYVFDADGAPVEGARVLLMAGEDAVPNLEAGTDAHGAYTLAGVPLGVNLVPRTEDPRVSGDAVAFRDPGEVQRRDIRFPALATLTVTVRGPDGESVELPDVYLEHEGRRIWQRSRDWSFEAPPGRYLLTVRPFGWPSLSREVVLEAGGSHKEIVLSSGLAIEGTVIAMDGSPLPGHVYWHDATLWGRAKADADGRFRIDGLTAAPVRLLVSAPDHAVVTRDGVVPGGPPVVIALQPAARITGRVVGHERADYLYARIWSESSSGNCDSLKDDGRFEFVVDHVGEPVTLAFRRGVLEAPVVLSLPPLAAGEARDLGEIRFEVGRTVRGRVLGADGKPAVGAFVDLAEAWCQEGDPLSTRTDESGRFCLLRLPKGPLWVRVDVEGYPPHFLRVEEDAVEFRLTTGGVAEGRGEASFRLSGLSDWVDNATVEATPDADGSYSVRLQPGHYRGWIDDEDGKTLDLVPFVIREGETTKVAITPR